LLSASSLGSAQVKQRSYPHPHPHPAKTRTRSKGTSFSAGIKSSDLYPHPWRVYPRVVHINYIEYSYYNVMKCIAYHIQTSPCLVDHALGDLLVQFVGGQHTVRTGRLVGVFLLEPYLVRVPV
jgi:hypothetical protein